MGTDELGQDLLTRLLYGGRVSLFVGAGASAIATVIGTAYGGIAGLHGGRLDALMMRFVDFVLAFPAIFLLLLLASFQHASVVTITLYIGLFGWMPIARLTRGQVLGLRERDFVVATRSLGAGSGRLIFRHLVPNALAPVIVAATLGAGEAILLEAVLDFIGFGVPVGVPSWGNLVASGRQYLATAPVMVAAPGMTISLALVSLNYIGDALRDALDPHEPDRARVGAGAARGGDRGDRSGRSRRRRHPCSGST
jgi:peptide/nickel transport system permease protein